jgi:hypothetical protein
MRWRAALGFGLGTRDTLVRHPPLRGVRTLIGVNGAAFYCVADRHYFLGAVAMLNSLRLQGHGEPVFVLDCGLEPGQRRSLEAEATVIPAPPRAAEHPWLAKPVAPLAHPADVTVLIDVDMIVTRSLRSLIERAAKGRVVAFANDRDRFVREWGALLDLGPVRRRRYVSSGLVLLGGDRGREVLELLDDRQRVVEVDRGLFGRNERGYPFTFPEQDVLNAILCTRRDGEEVVTLEHRLAATPPFRGLRLEDPKALRCSYRDGVQPYVLHHFAGKPWLEAMRRSVFSLLLTRLLLGADVPLRLSPQQVPLRLRTGPGARVARFAVDYAIGGPSYLRRRLRELHEDRTKGPFAAEGH